MFLRFKPFSLHYSSRIGNGKKPHPTTSIITTTDVEKPPSYSCKISDHEREEISNIVSLRTMSQRKKMDILKGFRKPVPQQTLPPSEYTMNFMRGSGPGGSNRDHNSNCVQIIHHPSGIVVRNHETRSLDLNKKLAWKSLFGKLDDVINGPVSLSALDAVKRAEVKRNKDRGKRRKKELC